MKSPHSPIDEYELRARLLPSLVVTFPVIAFVYGIIPNARGLLGGASGSVLELAALTVLMRIGRDRGAALQGRLHERWGGRPTTIILRHADSRLDPYTKQRYKSVLSRMTGLTMPDADEERANPTGADQVYDSCIRALIEKRRGKVYRLLFNENCNYGFVRNLAGLKPIGIIIVAVTLGLDALVFHRRLASIDGLSASMTVSILTGAVLLMITGSSVRRSGDAYAEALLRTCDAPLAKR